MSLRVVIASSSLLALPTFEILASLSEVEIVGLLSTPDRPKGRHGTNSPNHFAAHFLGRNMEVRRPSTDSELLQTLNDMTPDLVVVIAYGKLIKESALHLPRYGWINLHFSRLPEFRGAAPVQRALEQGAEKFGFTIFQLDEGMDSGPVYLQEWVEFSKTSCATEILEELSIVGAQAFPKVFEMILRQEKPLPQEGKATIASKFTKEDTHLDLTKGGDGVLNQLRAFTREPGVWTLLNGKRVIFTGVRASERAVESGFLLFTGESLILGTNGTSVELLTMVPEGRREMTGPEFARGMRMDRGSVLKVDLA